MNHQEAQIIVLTPVKNEDWILKEFLAATSRFADCIIVADQNSNDRSPFICKDFEKVVLIKNDSRDFNESERQKILIDKARALFPNNKRILLGLDADEIVAYDGLAKIQAWERIKSLPPGTTLFF